MSIKQIVLLISFTATGCAFAAAAPVMVEQTLLLASENFLLGLAYQF